jgi:hydrogenase expression/formation protein HypC
MTVCIGLPMRVVRADDQVALCEGRDGPVRLDNMLVGAVPPGTWLLAFQGRALRPMTEEEAVRTTSALLALEIAMRDGGANLDAFFADLAGREPELPEHLKRGAP